MTDKTVKELIEEENCKKRKQKNRSKLLRLEFGLGFLSLITVIAALYFRNINRHTFVKPQVGTAVLSVYATGNVEPQYGASISSLISGKVEQILVTDGDEVKKDQILVILDSGVEEAKLKELQANHRFLKSDLKRKKDLRDKGFYSDSEYERALNEYNVADAKLEYQKELIERMKIRSPINGIIIREDIDVGEYIKPDYEILWVGQKHPLILTTDVDEEDIPLIKLGQTALIKSDAYVDRAIEGEIYKITPMGDAIDKNFRVRIKLPKDSGLMIGMTTEVNIVVREEPNSLILPLNTLIGNTVYIKNGKVGKIKPVKVKIGIKHDGYVQILEGISKDDEVVVNPAKTIRNIKR